MLYLYISMSLLILFNVSCSPSKPTRPTAKSSASESSDAVVENDESKDAAVIEGSEEYNQDANDLSSKNWVLAWSDEFDGEAIDKSKWEQTVDGEGDGNNDLQYYTDRSKNSYVEDGVLYIKAIKESYQGSAGSKNYTSARLSTLNKGDWKYGKIEIKAKLPFGKGVWSAIRMLPTDWIYGGWAASGEIDIMESVNLKVGESNEIHGTLHYGGKWPDNIHTGESYTPKSSVVDEYHIYTIEWEEHEIRWYVDGYHYQTQTDWHSDSGDYPAPFNQRFHLILNVAVGGSWPGNPDQATSFPQTMAVDYVRVFELDTKGPEEVPKEPEEVDSPKVVSEDVVFHSYNMEISEEEAKAIIRSGNYNGYLDFYESSDNRGVAKGATFVAYNKEPHPELFNKVHKYWESNALSGYPYIGRSMVGRGNDDLEVGACSPSGVFDLQMHPPDSEHSIVAAFNVPVTGDYLITNLGIRRISGESGRVSLNVFNQERLKIASIATDSQAWSFYKENLLLSGLKVGEKIYISVYNEDGFDYDASEVTWSIVLNPSDMTNYTNACYGG